MPNQVPEPVKQERLRRLMKTQERVSRRRLRRLLGRRISVQMDTPATGRTEWDAPEIDGTVRLVGSISATGRAVDVRVTRTGTHDVWAEAD
jgi:ribosomal protein S12 methylthiotransferase